jgi:hypothetical protein
MPRKDELGNDGQYESEAPDVSFQSVHRNRATGHYLKKGRDLPPAGGDDGIESKYIRCNKCGFILDVTRRGPGTGYGNTASITYPRSITMRMS